MSTRLAQRFLTAALLVAGATAAGTGAAAAGVVPASAAHVTPQQYHNNERPVCNNDPDSQFAMDPEFCPPSNNDNAYDGGYDYGYPGAS